MVSWMSNANPQLYRINNLDDPSIEYLWAKYITNQNSRWIVTSKITPFAKLMRKVVDLIFMFQLRNGVSYLNFNHKIVKGKFWFINNYLSLFINYSWNLYFSAVWKFRQLHVWNKWLWMLDGCKSDRCRRLMYWDKIFNGLVNR